MQGALMNHPARRPQAELRTAPTMPTRRPRARPAPDAQRDEAPTTPPPPWADGPERLRPSAPTSARLASAEGHLTPARPDIGTRRRGHDLRAPVAELGWQARIATRSLRPP